MGDRVITYLTFDDVIEKTYVERQIGPLTFISRIGGFIGIGKNLLWIVIIILSSVKIFSRKVKSRQFDIN